MSKNGFDLTVNTTWDSIICLLTLAVTPETFGPFKHCISNIVKLMGIHVDLPRNKDGATALCIACDRGMPPVVMTLVDLGADVNYTTCRGLTPLMYNQLLRRSMVKKMLKNQDGHKVTDCKFGLKAPLAINFTNDKDSNDFKCMQDCTFISKILTAKGAFEGGWSEKTEHEKLQISSSKAFGLDSKGNKVALGASINDHIANKVNQVLSDIERGVAEMKLTVNGKSVQVSTLQKDKVFEIGTKVRFTGSV